IDLGRRPCHFYLVLVPRPAQGRGTKGNTVRRTHQGPRPWLPPQLYAASFVRLCHWRKPARPDATATREPGDLPAPSRGEPEFHVHTEGVRTCMPRPRRHA